MRCKTNQSYPYATPICLHSDTGSSYGQFCAAHSGYTTYAWINAIDFTAYVWTDKQRDFWNEIPRLWPTARYKQIDENSVVWLQVKLSTLEADWK